ncbi:MAG: ATP-binding protein [Bacillota bacterium]
MKYINRVMERIMLELSQQYPAILLTGPRQVGKTTMLKKLMEGTDRKYVTLDDLNIRELAKTDPAMFFQIYKPPILIDEVQYAPELFSAIKMIIDDTGKPGDFWLTGSQIFKLMHGVQESLAGRIAILQMSSLSQIEFMGTEYVLPFKIDFPMLAQKQQLVKAIETPEMFKRIFTGGMPAILSGKYTDSSLFYMSYLSSYLERDVRELSGAIDSLKFLKFITAVAGRCSQIVNYADIARDADINQITVKNWLTILETLGIIFYLHPYSNNVLKRTVKTPKLYFYDTGLVVYLTKWSSPETLENGAMSGAMFENYVISEIVKGYHNAATIPFIYYYRDKDMKEIDLIIEADGKLSPVEIKKSASPAPQLTSVFKILDRQNIERGNGAVICMKNSLSAFDSKNFIIPAWLV